ncbi:mutS protein homolog 4-like [Pseudomyrmex gracilis]|uniref:mutS protein homolog 4-like n=1 Tax=Pseudomyrmex gracilis TaxID=219809 RepID=UPI0009955FE9|nr:mutS protein homolog 4-like [Pseudomyrmex gracilis]
MRRDLIFTSGPATTSSSVGTGNRTSTQFSTSSNTDSWIVIALTAGRGDARNEVGLAAIDLQYPYLVLCQISDCQTYVNTLTKINILDPIEVKKFCSLEILMPETMCERRGHGNKLYELIKEKFNALNITPISRIHFNESIGMERVQTLCSREYSSVELIVKQKYYALAAAAALLKYVEYVQHTVYVPKSVRIEYQGSPNTTMIDLESARSLELVASQSKLPIVSLLGTMDRCVTPMGRRLLRASILQPSCDERSIADKQSCVAELVNNRSLFMSLQVYSRAKTKQKYPHPTMTIHPFSQPVIQRLFGTDRLLTLAMKPLHVNDIQNAERNLNYALLLKSCLDNIPELEAILASGVHPFFVKTRKNLANSEFRVMKDKISTLIHTDARFVKGCTSLSMQRCFAIKADINELLDVARQIYCELISDMKNMVEQLSVKHKLLLSLEHSVNLGYHINVAVPRNLNMKISDLPAEFIQARKNRRSFTVTTTALLTLNKQCKKACEEIYMMSNTLLTHLLEDIKQHVGCLFQLSADVAELDLMLSLAQISSNPEYVRPSFGTKLELINSLHPIMELFNRELPVSNDVNASVSYNFHLITGPNMSGKSTYLKQIVLLQIMAQIGSYVPATKATFRVADRILCRINSRDDAELNASAFVVEIKEAQYILQSVTPKSLVILDELCRHTTVEEGSAIAWSICEKLSLTSAFTFAATHFLHLTALSNMYYNVTMYVNILIDDIHHLLCNHFFFQIIHHFIFIIIFFLSLYCLAALFSHCFETKTDAEDSGELRLTYNHKLTLGIGPIDHYGIALAEVSSLPKRVTTKAREYANNQRSVLGAQKNFASLASTSSWEKSCYNTVVQLRALLDDNRFTFANIISIMKQLDLQQRRQQVPSKATQVFVRETHVPAKSTRVTRKETEKHEKRKTLVSSENALIEQTSGNVLPNTLSRQKNREPDDESMEIEIDNERDLSMHDTIVNRTTFSPLLHADTKDAFPTVSSSVSQLTIDSKVMHSFNDEQSTRPLTDVDPRFYVCTSFASSQKTTTTLSLGSNVVDANSGVTSPSSEFCRSLLYHDYCLSENDFNSTLPSQSESSEIAKIITPRSKEVAIFRQIEDDDFDEKAFFVNTQAQLELDLVTDNDASP